MTDLLLKEIEELKKNRGVIIEATLKIENILGNIITTYFTKGEKASEFLDKILNQEFFTLTQKLKIFSRLELHKRHNYPKLSNDIERIINVRNAVAHSKSYFITTDEKYKINKAVSDETKMYVATFPDPTFKVGIDLKEKGKKKYITLDTDFTNNFLIECKKTETELLDIFKKMEKKE